MIHDVGDDLGLWPSSLMISEVFLEAWDGSRLIDSKCTWREGELFGGRLLGALFAGALGHVND